MGDQKHDYVIVLDANQTLLLPCRAAKARKLLKQGRATVFCVEPFTIILNDVIPNPISPVIEEAVEDIEPRNVSATPDPDTGTITYRTNWV